MQVSRPPDHSVTAKAFVRMRASAETKRAAEENTGLGMAIRVLAERLSESGGPGSGAECDGRRCCEASLARLPRKRRYITSVRMERTGKEPDKCEYG